MLDAVVPQPGPGWHPSFGSVSAILDALPANVAVLDSHAVIRSVNRAWREFGRANDLALPDAGVGTSYLAICEAAELDPAAQDVARGLRSVLRGETHAFMLEYPCHSPTERRWFQVRVAPFQDDTFRGALVVHMDITARRLSEAALRASEKRLRAILDRETDCVAVCSAAGEIVDLNAAGLKLLGAQAAEPLVGRCLFDFVHADDRAAYQQAHQRALQGERARAQYRVRQLSGTLRWVDGSFAPLVDEESGSITVLSASRDVTEERHTASELQQLRVRTSHLLNSIGDGVLGLEADGTVVFLNPAAASILGVGKDGVDRNVCDLVHRGHAELHPPGECPMMTALADGSVHRSDAEVFVRADGNTVPVEYVCSPVAGAGKGAGGAVLCFRDVTARKRDEAALRESEQRFELMARATNDAVWDWLYPNKVWWSEGFHTLFGSLPNDREASIETWAQRIHPDEREAVLDGLHRALHGDAAHWSAEYRFERADGTYAHVVDQGFILRDEHGAVVRMTGGMKDITELKGVQERLAEQAALLDRARDAITVRDLDGKVIYWNAGAERLYGWTRDEIMGRNLNQQLTVVSERDFQTARSVVLTQGDWRGELEYTRKDGAKVLVEAGWTLLRDARGEPKGILAITTDITERKKLEQRLLRVQRLESLGTVSGGIAHDLNNVLTPILFCIECLRLGDPNEAARKELDTIEACVRRGAAMVKQVLLFARGVEGERTPTHLGAAAREIQRIIGDTFPRNIKLQLEVSSDLRIVSADPTQMTQVLMNLCVNARDAMPNGGTLSISLANTTVDDTFAQMHPEARVGPYVLMRVTDTGHGMTSSVLERAFEPFFTTKEQGRGTGLGLSTTHAIVRSHGGFLDVSSEVGEGTTFKVYIPALTRASTADPELLQDELPRGSGEVVLVVDDEEAIRGAVKRMLEAFGYRVLLASNGAEAVAAFTKHQDEIDLVLTDMAMPVMDGYATVVALRALDPRVPIVGSSGLPATGERSFAAAQLRHFVVKPYTAKEMLVTLREALCEQA